MDLAGRKSLNNVELNDFCVCALLLYFLVTFPHFLQILKIVFCPMDMAFSYLQDGSIYILYLSINLPVPNSKGNRYMSFKPLALNV